MDFVREPDLIHPDGLLAWTIEPFGFVTHMRSATYLTEAMARWIIEDVHNLAGERRGLANGMSVYNDWLDMTGYDTGARKVCTAWAMQQRHQIALLQVSVRPRNRIATMGIQVASMSLRAVGLSVRIDDESPEVMDDLLRVPLAA